MVNETPIYLSEMEYLEYAIMREDEITSAEVKRLFSHVVNIREYCIKENFVDGVERELTLFCGLMTEEEFSEKERREGIKAPDGSPCPDNCSGCLLENGDEQVEEEEQEVAPARQISESESSDGINEVGDSPESVPNREIELQAGAESSSVSEPEKVENGSSSVNSTGGTNGSAQPFEPEQPETSPGADSSYSGNGSSTSEADDEMSDWDLEIALLKMDLDELMCYPTRKDWRSRVAFFSTYRNVRQSAFDMIRIEDIALSILMKHAKRNRSQLFRGVESDTYLSRKVMRYSLTIDTLASRKVYLNLVKQCLQYDSGDAVSQRSYLMEFKR